MVILMVTSFGLTVGDLPSLDLLVADIDSWKIVCSNSVPADMIAKIQEMCTNVLNHGHASVLTLGKRWSLLNQQHLWLPYIFGVYKVSF